MKPFAAFAIVIFALLAGSAHASTSAIASSAASPDPYLVQPGDILVISVWREQELQREVLVRPDGGLSFPLAGDLRAAGHSIEALQTLLAQKLQRYIPDPVVTVAIKQIGGNRVYVIGKVNRPGEFAFNRPIDVMQALSLAGGATPFAALNDILILRRENGRPGAIRFRYGDVENGKDLEQNVLLRSDDTVVVP